ncbi:MAG: glycosyltransferase family 2 protein [Oscillatoriophycideae cyanobacterium NC_groundwater_1537_Pr4_S-0.65um_50_18]|nr:glycosyltransferase family 2 protein [Oscillatoriophycideae cyanobacterium NC_groundwater_1537_Pr4_S-0.65um_50_18]
MLPLVSVLITVRNAEAYISETLASILQERTIPLEIVLVDNGCTDKTVEKALAFQDERIRIIPGPKKGISHALNVAYAAAQGEIIMRCDGDDLFPPERITRQVGWLKANPDFGAVCGGFSTIDVKSALLANLGLDADVQEITEELRSGETRTHIGTFAMRAEAVKASGYSREYFDCFEDIDFQLRLGETCRVGYLCEIEYCYRLHPKSVTHSQSNTLREFYDATALEFQRQRLTTGEDNLQRGCPPPLPRPGDKSGISTASHVQGMLLQSAWAEHQAGRKQKALAFGLRSMMTQPISLSAWRNLFALAVKPCRRTLKISGRV